MTCEHIVKQDRAFHPLAPWLTLLALPAFACSMAPAKMAQTATPSANYRGGDMMVTGNATSMGPREEKAGNFDLNTVPALQGGQGKLGGAQPPAPPTTPPAQPQTRAQPKKEALVVEGWLTLEVAEVPEAARALQEFVDGAGGRVVNEQLNGSERAWSGHLKVKLPPERVDEFLAWLGKTGDITNKRIQATDVSRTLFDQKIALDNLQLTLDRMRKLLDRENMDMKDILAIEREMTRLRGEIERIKGEKRFLEYRVAMATLDINLRRRQGVILGRAKAKFYPGARLSMLTLLDPNGRARTRLGGGAVVHFLQSPRLSLELDVFPGVDDEPTSVLATYGVDAFSDFLGRGKRRYLNPYLGLRIGYGYVHGHAFAFSGRGGVELFKHEHVLIDANVNVVGLARKDFDTAVTGSLNAIIAF